jgi:hypothetical protein
VSLTSLLARAARHQWLWSTVFSLTIVALCLTGMYLDRGLFVTYIVGNSFAFILRWLDLESPQAGCGQAAGYLLRVQRICLSRNVRMAALRKRSIPTRTLVGNLQPHVEVLCYLLMLLMLLIAYKKLYWFSGTAFFAAKS